MPIGSFAVVPELVQALLIAQPRSVLDLGLGFGGGGVLVREWLDLGVRPWRTHLVGVECWADYRNPVWDLYDVVYLQTMEQFLEHSRQQFDVVLLSDVLEHFERPEGEWLLNKSMNVVAPGGQLFVTTPATFFPQDASHGNEREQHRVFWSEEDLRRFRFSVRRVGSPDFYCGESWFASWRNEVGR